MNLWYPISKLLLRIALGERYEKASAREWRFFWAFSALLPLMVVAILLSDHALDGGFWVAWAALVGGTLLFFLLVAAVGYAIPARIAPVLGIVGLIGAMALAIWAGVNGL